MVASWKDNVSILFRQSFYNLAPFFEIYLAFLAQNVIAYWGSRCMDVCNSWNDC